MTDPRHIDDEMLAAFIDNTLAPAERARVAAMLSTDPMRYQEFIDAASIVAELEAPLAAKQRGAAGADAPVRQRNWLAIGAPVLLAAGIAAVLWLRPHRDVAPLTTYAVLQQRPIVAAGGADAVQRALGTGWDQPQWSAVRGGGGAMTLAAGVRARLGARAVELEVAGAANDSVAARAVAESLAALLGAAPGAAPVVAQLRAQPMGDAAERATRTAQLRALSGDTAAFDAGVWVEAVRLRLRRPAADALAKDGVELQQLAAVMRALQASADAPDWTPALVAMRALRDKQDGTVATQRELVDAIVAALPGEGDPGRE